MTKSLLIFDLVFPPCSHLPKAERQKELRRRQRLRAKARDKGYAPLVGRPLEWKTECWPAVDTSEAFLAWFRWALDQLGNPVLPDLEWGTSYRNDAILLRDHLIAQHSFSQPPELPNGEDRLTVRELLVRLIGWIEATDTRQSATRDRSTRKAERLTQVSDDATSRLLSLYTSGVFDGKIQKACEVLTSDLTAGEKIQAIDNLIPIPPTASAETLAKVLNVSKTTVVNSSWWTVNRRGKKAEEIERRASQSKERARRYEVDR